MKGTENAGDVGDEDDQHAEQTGSFGVGEEGGDEIAEHCERESEAEEEEAEEREVGVLEDGEKHQGTAHTDEQKLEEINNKPGPHQRQIFQSLQQFIALPVSTIVFNVSRIPFSFSVTMFRRIQKHGYMNVIKKKIG